MADGYLPPFGFSLRPGSSFNRYGQIDPGRSLPIAEGEEEEAHPRSPGSIQGHTIHQCSTLEILRKGSSVGARQLVWERLYGCVGTWCEKKNEARGLLVLCHHAITHSPRERSPQRKWVAPPKTQLLIWIVPHLAHLEWICCSFTFVTVLEGADMENQSERSHSLTHACPNSTEGDGEGGEVKNIRAPDGERR
jgi:hypothetical protein